MEFLNFKHYSLWVNIAVFAISAGAVWIAGARVARYADAIARITGIGRAAVGLILLGGITSLPEVAVALSASLMHSPVLAVNNILGGVAMQKAVLAGADFFIAKDALTVVVSSANLLLQGALNILLLAIVAAAIVLGDTPVFGIGIWSWSIFLAYAWIIWILTVSEGRHPWQAKKEQLHAKPDGETAERLSRDPLQKLINKTALAALVILAAGYLLSQTGDAIAAKTGLGQSFVGAVLLALSTSLPEISTVTSAVRLRQYEMAISDILGTNMFNLALIFLIDAAYRGGPVLNSVGQLSLFVAVVSIALTTIYLVGLIERRNRTVFGMGIDSLATLGVYAGSLIIMYRLR